MAHDDWKPDEWKGWVARRTDQASGNRYMRFKVDDRYIYGGTNSVCITVSYLDVKNFCCPDYLVTMLQLIQSRWNAVQQVTGEAVVVFRIQRDGRLTDIELERSSGYPALDLTAQRALFQTQRVPPLPSAFPDDHLTVHLKFEYRR